MLSLSRIVAGVAFGFLLLMAFLACLSWVSTVLENLHA